MNIDLLKAEHSDRLFLARVCRDADLLYSRILPGAFESQAKKYEEKGLPAAYDSYLIKINGRKIGFLGFTEINRYTVYLVALYLLLCYQRKGYGRAVLENLLEYFSDQGYKEVVLLAHKDACWAIKFYMQNRFKVVSHDPKVIQSYAGHGMERYALPSTVLMRKSLGPGFT